MITRLRYLLTSLLLTALATGTVGAQPFLARQGDEPILLLWQVAAHDTLPTGLLQRMVLQVPGFTELHVPPLVRIFPYTDASGTRWNLVHISGYESYPQANQALDLLRKGLPPSLTDTPCALVFITAANFKLAYRGRRIGEYCTHYLRTRGSLY